jgi:PiT family inorganic phosphate transporter
MSFNFFFSTTTGGLVVIAISFLAALFLAFTNGANDNFKGVATLYGSQTSTYRQALTWASITTFLGSIAALFLAQALAARFTGRGLVPDEVIATTGFAGAVAAGAALTVLAASILGMPISTTHAIVGALVGAGFSSGAPVNILSLQKFVFLPLVMSPLVAGVASFVIYLLLHRLRKAMGIGRETCVCVGRQVLAVAPAAMTQGANSAVVQLPQWPSLSIDTQVNCQKKYTGNLVGVQASTLVDVGHYLSAGLVSFARGLNDTPKLAAILLLLAHFSPQTNFWMVGVTMILGGWFFSQRVAQTVSKDITEMTEGQGASTNFVTSLIVLGASAFSLPVSTTHVSCGALFGLGAANKKINWGTFSKIIMAWVFTLPMSGILSFVFFWLLKSEV